jgi:hypothetical protein
MQEHHKSQLADAGYILNISVQGARGLVGFALIKAQFKLVLFPPRCDMVTASSDKQRANFGRKITSERPLGTQWCYNHRRKSGIYSTGDTQQPR